MRLHIVLMFVLLLQACKSGESRTGDADSVATPSQAAMAADTDSTVTAAASAAQRLCQVDTLPAGVQRKVTGGDTLVLGLQREGEPGPEYLVVDGPFEYEFFVVYPHAPQALSRNPTSDEFRAMETFSFQVDQLIGKQWVYGSADTERVFREPGIYLLTWGLNFESEAACIQDSIRVLYCPDG